MFARAACWSCYKNMGMSSRKHLRCNPDVAPRLTSGCYEDKVDVITPIHILFLGGGKIWMWWSWCDDDDDDDDNDDDDDDDDEDEDDHDDHDDHDDLDDHDDHDDCKCGATFGLGRTCFFPKQCVHTEGFLR